MGHFNEVRRCHCCGSVLQSNKKNEVGYIKKPFLNNEEYKESILYCDSCYQKMKAFNAIMIQEDVDDDIITILKDAKATDGTIVYVVDPFQFNGYINPEVVKLIKKLNVILIISHIDLFNKKVKDDKIEALIESQFISQGIKPKYTFSFSKYNHSISEESMNKIKAVRGGHDIYVIGSSLSGKTTLISTYLKYYKNKTNKEIVRIPYKGTDVSILEIPLDKTSYLFELPGFSSINSALGKVEKDVIKQLIPSKTIKKTTHHLISNDAILIGNVASISLISGKDGTIKIYTSEQSEILKTRRSLIENFMKKNIVKRILRPVSESLNTFLDYDMVDYVFENDGKYRDIIINGVGWFSFKSKGQVVRIGCPKGVMLKDRLSLID